MGSSIAPENKKFDVIGGTHYNAKAEVFCPDMFTSLSEGSPKSQVTSKTIFQRGGGGDFVMYASTGQLSC